MEFLPRPPTLQAACCCCCYSHGRRSWLEQWWWPRRYYTRPGTSRLCCCTGRNTAWWCPVSPPHASVWWCSGRAPLSGQISRQSLQRWQRKAASGSSWAASCKGRPRCPAWPWPGLSLEGPGHSLPRPNDLRPQEGAARSSCGEEGGADVGQGRLTESPWVSLLNPGRGRAQRWHGNKWPIKQKPLRAAKSLAGARRGVWGNRSRNCRSGAEKALLAWGPTSGCGCSDLGGPEWLSSRQPRPGQTPWSSWGRWTWAWSTSPERSPGCQWQCAHWFSDLFPLWRQDVFCGHFYLKLLGSSAIKRPWRHLSQCTVVGNNSYSESSMHVSFLYLPPPIISHHPALSL